MSDQEHDELDQEGRDRVVFERLATEFGPDVALRNLEAKRAARAAGLPDIKPRVRPSGPRQPRKLDREVEKRVRERQAQILGIPLAELERIDAGEKARRARTGRTGYTPIRDHLQAFAARHGIERLAYDTCGRCGRKVPDRNELGGQPLRCDPIGQQGFVCCGFFDETGQRIDCYDELERHQADKFGRELEAARRARAEQTEQKGSSGRSRGRADRVKPQQGLPLDKEPPF